jgi:hypothetical protein
MMSETALETLHILFDLFSWYVNVGVCSHVCFAGAWFSMMRSQIVTGQLDTG